MATFIELYGATIPVVQTQIRQLCSGFTSLYVSIGSKFNDPDVYFSETHGKKHVTNARYQMYPRFLRGRPEEEKIGVIVVDDFRNKPLFKQNRQLLQQVAEENATIVLVDHCFTRATWSSFIAFITDTALTMAIPKQQFMICNFVRHANRPNAIEFRAEEMIPVVIQEVLDLPAYSMYRSCFYQWFGYRMYTYNFVYNYRRFQSASYTLQYELEQFIQTLLKTNSSSEIVIQQPELLDCIKYIYDIQMFREPGWSLDSLSVSMNDYLQMHGIVVTPYTMTVYDTDDSAILA
jgi:hypothetical protein